MKKLLRYFIINLVSLWITTQIITGLSYSGGLRSLILGGIAFMLINFILVPILRILFLPLNLLTLGLFAWVTNVLALYALTTVVSDFRLNTFTFAGANLSGLIIPSYELSPLMVAVVASFLIGLITHFLQWLAH